MLRVPLGPEFGQVVTNQDHFREIRDYGIFAIIDRFCACDASVIQAWRFRDSPR